MKYLILTALAASLLFTASAQILLPGGDALLLPEPPTSPGTASGSVAWADDPVKSLSWVKTQSPTTDFAYVVRAATGLVVTPLDDYVQAFNSGRMWQESGDFPEEVWLRVYLSDEQLAPGDPVGDYLLRSVRFGFDRPGVASTEFDVPEPSHLALLAGVGLLGFAAYRRF